MAEMLADETVVADGVVTCVEALLMTADAPLSVARLVSLLETHGAPDRAAMRMALQALAARYEEAAVDLVEVAEGWRFQVGADYADLVARLWEERPSRLSRAMLETLALICYRQPIARSEIEHVRGVSVSSSIVKTLQEYAWIKVVGYREVPGRPALFGTTQQFLNDFGVRKLDELPALPEIRDLDALDAAVARLQGKDGAAGDTDFAQAPGANDTQNATEGDVNTEAGLVSDRKHDESQSIRTPGDATK